MDLMRFIFKECFKIGLNQRKIVFLKALQHRRDLMEVLFLGTGTSHGVPSIDCMMSDYVRCKKNVCRESEYDRKHYRTRSSILVSWNGYNVLVDVSADFRYQALREKIKHIDAVLITHGHADHIGGMPDIRSYTKDPETALKVYGSPESTNSIRGSFNYIFDPNTFVGGGIPLLDTISVTDCFNLFGKMITTLPVTHGNLSGCYGYRIGDLAYIPDMKQMSDNTLEKLKDLDVLILNCLRDERPHSTHLILPESIDLAKRIGANRVYFIHMCHDIHYQMDSKYLESNQEFSYDGLQINVRD